MPDIRTIVVFVAVTASLLALWGWSEVGRYQGLYKDSQVSLLVAQARLRSIQTNIPKVDKKNEELRFALDESLRLNREWADRRTPDAVYDGLCSRANCARVQPLPSPAD